MLGMTIFNTGFVKHGDLYPALLLHTEYALDIGKVDYNATNNDRSREAFAKKYWKYY